MASAGGFQTGLGRPSQMFPNPDIAPSQHHSIGSHEDVSKITMEKSESSKREFIVHDEQDHQVLNFCKQYDITGRSGYSGSVMAPPASLQQFPPHTIRHADQAQVQQYNRSHHSDTSSSVHSGATSFHSTASFGDHSGQFLGSAGTRQVSYY